VIVTRIIPGEPALLLDGKKRHLIVTDLHIGFESSLTENKIFVGKNTTLKESVEKIFSIIDSQNPHYVILLGDIKSGISRILKNEWTEIPQFLKKISEKADVILIPGNHDANISRLVPAGITMTSSMGTVLENMLLTHGHAMPSENFSHVDKIVMGHVHPVFFDEDSILNGQRVWVSIKTKKENIFPSGSGELEITIVPSFNRYFYATKKKQYKKSISPIIEKVKNSSTARIATLDGTIIGDESILSKIL
jgi:putative SbcD/Mre11-related phosphoesterase